MKEWYDYYKITVSTEEETLPNGDVVVTEVKTTSLCHKSEASFKRLRVDALLLEKAFEAGKAYSENNWKQSEFSAEDDGSPDFEEWLYNLD